MEKFERLNEPKPKWDFLDNLLFFIILAVGAILFFLWYYQNFTLNQPDYAEKNKIKSLEEQERFLEGEIKRIEKEVIINSPQNTL